LGTRSHKRSYVAFRESPHGSPDPPRYGVAQGLSQCPDSERRFRESAGSHCHSHGRHRGVHDGTLRQTRMHTSGAAAALPALFDRVPAPRPVASTGPGARGREASGRDARDLPADARHVGSRVRRMRRARTGARVAEAAAPAVSRVRIRAEPQVRQGVPRAEPRSETSGRGDLRGPARRTGRRVRGLREAGDHPPPEQSHGAPTGPVDPLGASRDGPPPRVPCVPVRVTRVTTAAAEPLDRPPRPRRTRVRRDASRDRRRTTVPTKVRPSRRHEP
jgi:hypothetical protein